MLQQFMPTFPSSGTLIFLAFVFMAGFVLREARSYEQGDFRTGILVLVFVLCTMSFFTALAVIFH